MSSRDTDHVLILSTAVIRNSRGEILLLQRSNSNKSFRGLWQLPEGKIHFGEQAQEALKRELKEELDLELKHARLLFAKAVTISSHQQRFHVQRLVFKVQCTGSITLSPDHTTFQWFAKKKLRSIDLFPGTQEILACLNVVSLSSVLLPTKLGANGLWQAGRGETKKPREKN